jgi:hypothetical protein
MAVNLSVAGDVLNITVALITEDAFASIMVRQ